MSTTSAATKSEALAAAIAFYQSLGYDEAKTAELTADFARAMGRLAEIAARQLREEKRRAQEQSS